MFAKLSSSLGGTKTVAPAGTPKEFLNEKPTTLGEHTLPASWWTSPAIFELEKRAVFNKVWLYTIHSSRFKKPGDYFQFTVVGLNFFLIKTKKNEIKAFHNVCRHRAYPVIKKEKGSSVILGCKYHGWSYNTDGELTKAPHFDDVPGFDKLDNGLFEIKTHITKQGLIYINFDQGDDVIPFDDWFKGMQTEMEEYDFSDYEYEMSYELDGQFNWKTLMDGYQECYHCPTAHPGLSKLFDIPNTYKVVPKSNYCRHYAQIKDSPDNVGGEFNGLWCYCFPTNGINCYSPAWYSIRVLPISPSHTILQYDIFCKKGLAEEKKKEFIDFLQLVELEDFNLCELTQKNLNQGIYSTGFLHPTKENGVLYYQNRVKDLVKEHFELEKLKGEEINPAVVGGKAPSLEAVELDLMCKELECKGVNPATAVEW